MRRDDRDPRHEAGRTADRRRDAPSEGRPDRRRTERAEREADREESAPERQSERLGARARFPAELRDQDRRGDDDAEITQGFKEAPAEQAGGSVRERAAERADRQAGERPLQRARQPEALRQSAGREAKRGAADLDQGDGDRDRRQAQRERDLDQRRKGRQPAELCGTDETGEVEHPDARPRRGARHRHAARVNRASGRCPRRGGCRRHRGRSTSQESWSVHD